MTKDSTANATATSTPDAVAANRPLLKVEDLHLCSAPPLVRSGRLKGKL